MSLNENSPLHFEKVEKSYGSNVVLRDFSFSLKPRETVALIGPSGSGKTTVLRCAMALERPTSGKIFVFGEDYWPSSLSASQSIRHLRKVRRPVGMVFQAYNLFPHMTVLQNMIEAPVGVLKQERSAAIAAAHLLLQKVGLGEKADAYPRSLSGGQQQRAAIARALMMNPKLLLLDEITSALDPELVSEVLAVVRGLARDGEVSLMIVTHEMRFARDVADRICVMEAGRIVEEGPPSQIFGSPKSERTQKFLQALEGAF